MKDKKMFSLKETSDLVEEARADIFRKLDAAVGIKGKQIKKEDSDDSALTIREYLKIRSQFIRDKVKK